MKMPYFFSLFKLLIALPLLFIVSCKEMVPNPELMDPIYKDLLAISKDYDKQVADAEKSIEGFKKDLLKALPRSPEVNIAKKAIAKSSKAIVYTREKAKYYKIAAERRRIEGRRDYKIAFMKEQPWPDPKEFEFYKVNKKLRAVDLNWQKRVPKLFKGNPNYDPKAFMMGGGKKDEKKKK